MAITELDICNQAIFKGGAGEILDELDEETPLGAFCIEAYPRKRAWLLSKHRWIFAKEIVSLPRRAYTPSNCPMAFAYERPEDLAGAFHDFRILPDEQSAKVRVSQASDFIASDAPVVWAEYTKVVPEARWDSWFEQLVITAFAADCARLALRRGLAADLEVMAFGTPELNGEGGLYLTAKIEDSRNAPARALTYEGGGPLVGARYGSGWPTFGAEPV